MNQVKEPAYLSLSDWQGMTKKEIATQAQTLVDVILETGGADKAAERLCNMENFIKEVKSKVEFVEEVRAEITRHNGKIETASGAKIELMEGGTKYHFDKCGDTVLPQLERQMEELKRQITHRQEFLKAAPAQGCEIMVNGGELITIYPPYKTSTSTYKITLAK